MKKIISFATLAVVSVLGFVSQAQAVNMVSISPLGDSISSYLPYPYNTTYYRFHAHWRVSNSGAHHICEVKWTSNGWASYTTGTAGFSHFDGATEIWTFQADIGSTRRRVEYVIMCEDLDKQVREIESNGTVRTSFGLELQSSVQSAE